MAGLLSGKHQLAVGKYVQHAAASHPELYFVHSGLLFQFALQAPGLMANVGSKKAALDFNFHGYPIHTNLDATHTKVVRSQQSGVS